MIGVRVRQRDDVDAMPPGTERRPELVDDARRIRPAVDEHGRSTDLHQVRVPLADVERGHTRRRAGRRPCRGDGDRRDGEREQQRGTAREGRPARTGRARHSCGRDDPHEDAAPRASVDPQRVRHGARERDAAQPPGHGELEDRDASTGERSGRDRQGRKGHGGKAFDSGAQREGAAPGQERHGTCDVQRDRASGGRRGTREHEQWKERHAYEVRRK